MARKKGPIDHEHNGLGGSFHRTDLRTMQLDDRYWEDRYTSGRIGWDLGDASTPLKEYIDQLTDKDLRILIPGGGHGYEAEYAFRKGFRNVHVVDLTDAPYKDLLRRCPDLPKENLIVGDFFEHDARYDRILEQTFFCALEPALRSRYVEHMFRLLSPGASLVGVLFDDELNTDQPPFGGSKAVYEPLFKQHFPDVSMEPCHNSIAPRAGRELWLLATKEKDYIPIDCNLYDEYESAATLKQRVRIRIVDGTTIEGIIVDLYIKDGSERMRLDKGAELRLDRIAHLAVARS